MVLRGLKPVDARSDIFSFGVVVYEMLTGVRAFSGESQLAILKFDANTSCDLWCFN